MLFILAMWSKLFHSQKSYTNVCVCEFECVRIEFGHFNSMLLLAVAVFRFAFVYVYLSVFVYMQFELFVCLSARANNVEQQQINRYGLWKSLWMAWKTVRCSLVRSLTNGKKKMKKKRRQENKNMCVHSSWLYWVVC